MQGVWGDVLKVLAAVAAFLQKKESKEREESEILENASPEDLVKLAESYIEQEVWDNLSKAQRKKIQYIRRKKKAERKESGNTRFKRFLGLFKRKK